MLLFFSSHWNHAKGPSLLKASRGQLGGCLGCVLFRPSPSDDMTNDRPASMFSSLSVPLPALPNAGPEGRILQMMVR